MTVKTKYEKALRKVLKILVNVSGKVDNHNKEIELHDDLLREHQREIRRLNHMLRMVKSEDIKNINELFKLVATKRGLKNAVQLLRDYDIESLNTNYRNMQKTAITWPKLIAGVSGVLILFNTLKELIGK